MRLPVCDHAGYVSSVHDRSQDVPFQIVAHRGVLDRAPGNSLAAFRAALGLGVDGVELDVRLSRDGVPIVHHNWYLDEQVAQPVPIYTLSAAQLRAETIRDDRADFSQQHPIPTLADVLHDFAGDLSLEIELKSPEPELPAAVARVLEPFRDLWSTFELTSFSTTLLAAVRDRCPGIRTALLFGPTQPYMHLDVVAYLALQSARLAQADIVHLEPNQLSEAVLGTIRAAGIEVHVYPVNDEQTVELVARYGVPEIITDDPAALLALRGSRGVAR
jgi:glycerophosphoryl diester phosphodiesterase